LSNPIDTEPYRVKLERVFEGPMDLLIHLIRKNEVNIYDIPIALITDQYLAYLEWMKAMNIDLAGDFLLMAASLAQIKSKLLLPVHDGQGDEEDPRMEIARPLAEYMKIKSAARLLAERDLLGEDIFARSPKGQDLPAPPDEVMIHVGLFELIDAFQRIMANLAPEQRLDLSGERISVKERINQIVDILEARGDVAFDELLDPQPSRADLIVTFLAVLEMVKLALVSVFQHSLSGQIRIFYQ
jgi:segregation and condensation protein A